MEEHGVSKIVGVKFGGVDDTQQRPRSVAETFGKHGNLHSEAVQSASEPALTS
jgi:hypothetical protein